MHVRLVPCAAALFLALTVSLAHAQCADWKAGPLDAGTAPNGADGTVYCQTYWDPDGAGPLPSELVVGGAFTTIGGVTANHVAILDSYTGTWQSLGGGVGCNVYALTVWNDKLIVGGGGDSDPGNTDDNILAWDGSTWTTFYGGTSTGSVKALAVYNGELYAGGTFVIFPSYLTPAHNLAHWSVARGLWETVSGPGTDPGQNVWSLCTWSNQLWAGTAYTDGAGGHGDVWSFDGASWTDRVSCNGAVYAFQPWNGVLAIGGGFSVVGTSSISGVMAFNGSIFYSVGGWPGGTAQALSVYNSQLVAVSNYRLVSGTPTYSVQSLNAGTWQTLGGTMNSYLYSLMPLGNDLVAGGLFTQADGNPANHLARWNGTAWAPFGGGNVAGVLAMTPYYGRLVFGGGFRQSTGSSPAVNIVGWNGTSLMNYGSGMDNQVNALKSYSFGPIFNQTNELVAGGYFTHAGGVACNYIAKWDQSSVLIGSPAWAPMGAGFDSAVLAIERATLNSTANTYAAGLFLWTGTTYLGHIGRWNATTSTWESMGGGMNGVIYALKYYNGYLYAGGSFTTAGGVSTGGLARWNGTSWSPCGGFFSGTVQALEVWNGVLVIGGSYPGINSSPNLAWYNGTSYGTYSTGGTNASVLALHATGTRLVIGGAFTTAGGVAASHAAYWDGAWHAMTAGVDDNVYALGDWGGESVAGGAFLVAGTQPVLSPHQARYSFDGLAYYLSQPYTQYADRGSNVTFTATPGTGFPGLTQKWLKDGVTLVNGPTGTGSTISGATGPSLTISNCSGFDAGNYRSVLTDACGDDSSNVAALNFSPTTGLGPDGAYATTFDAIGPNPSRGTSTLAFSLAHGARVGFRVMDVAGRLVARRELGVLGAGRHVATWDAHDEGGASVRSGLYFVTLEVDGAPLGVRRVTLVR